MQYITASDDIQITFASLTSLRIIPLARFLHDLSQKFARVKHKKAICPTFLNPRLIPSDSMDTNTFRGVEMRLSVVPLDPDKFYCPKLGGPKMGSPEPSPYDGS